MSQLELLADVEEDSYVSTVHIKLYDGKKSTTLHKEMRTKGADDPEEISDEGIDHILEQLLIHLGEKDTVTTRISGFDISTRSDVVRYANIRLADNPHGRENLFRYQHIN